MATYFLFTIVMCTITGCYVHLLSRCAEARIITRLNREKKKALHDQRRTISGMFWMGVKVGEMHEARAAQALPQPRRRELTAFLSVDAAAFRKNSN